MFFERLKEERKRLKLNQTDFGTNCGVTKMAQIRYEKGERQPDSDYLQKANEIGVDVGYLITGIRVQNNLSTDENLILEKYRKSDESTKNKVLLTLIGGDVTSNSTIQNSVVNSFNQK